MRVVARKVDWNACPVEISPYTKKSQTFLTSGREYDVHAVAVFGGAAALQVVDDLGYPSWEASWLFDVVEGTIPEDWICNVFRDEPTLLLGPEFVARDVSSYGAMVELEADQVDRFWKRVEARTRSNNEQT